MTDPDSVDPHDVDPHDVDPHDVDPHVVDPHDVDLHVVDHRSVDPGVLDPRDVDPASVDPDLAFEAARTRGAVARSALSADERRERTELANARLLRLPELAIPGPHGVIGASVAIRGELDITPSFDRLRDRGWRIALPVVADDLTMTFRTHMPGTALVPGRFAIPVPADGDGMDLTTAELDVVVVPCVAVDEAGTRVGFGAGCYDRALAEVAGRPFVVLVVFDVQVTDAALPTRAWDVPGDVVVTDRRTIRPSGTAGRRGPARAGDGSAGARAR